MERGWIAKTIYKTPVLSKLTEYLMGAQVRRIAWVHEVGRSEQSRSGLLSDCFGPATFCFPLVTFELRAPERRIRRSANRNCARRRPPNCALPGLAQ
jgi:hypothetical protein